MCSTSHLVKFISSHEYMQFNVMLLRRLTVHLYVQDILQRLAKSSKYNETSLIQESMLEPISSL